MGGLLATPVPTGRARPATIADGAGKATAPGPAGRWRLGEPRARRLALDSGAGIRSVGDGGTARLRGRARLARRHHGQTPAARSPQPLPEGRMRKRLPDLVV